MLTTVVGKELTVRLSGSDVFINSAKVTANDQKKQKKTKTEPPTASSTSSTESSAQPDHSLIAAAPGPGGALRATRAALIPARPRTRLLRPCLSVTPPAP